MKPATAFRPCILIACLAAGCAKDRTAEDYNTDRANQQIATIEQHKGTYQGLVYQQGEPTANFTLILSRAKVVPASDPNGRPLVLMVGSMIVQNAAGAGSPVQVLRKLDFDSIHYYSANHSFVGQLSDPTRAIQVDVAGSFSDGTVTGEIVSGNYPEWKGSFQARLTNGHENTRSIEYARLGRTRIPADLGVSYTGRIKVRSSAIYTPPSSGVNADSREVPIALTLENPAASAQSQNLAFAEFFLPVKSVQVRIEYGAMRAERSLEAQLDLRNPVPRLYGHANATTTSYGQTLDCYGLDNGGWSCTYDSGVGSFLPDRFELDPRPRGPNR